MSTTPQSAFFLIANDSDDLQTSRDITLDIFGLVDGHATSRMQPDVPDSYQSIARQALLRIPALGPSTGSRSSEQSVSCLEGVARVLGRMPFSRPEQQVNFLVEQGLIPPDDESEQVALTLYCGEVSPLRRGLTGYRTRRSDDPRVVRVRQLDARRLSRIGRFDLVRRNRCKRSGQLVHSQCQGVGDDDQSGKWASGSRIPSPSRIACTRRLKSRIRTLFRLSKRGEGNAYFSNDVESCHASNCEARRDRTCVVCGFIGDGVGRRANLSCARQWKLDPMAAGARGRRRSCARVSCRRIGERPHRPPDESRWSQWSRVHAKRKRRERVVE